MIKKKIKLIAILGASAALLTTVICISIGSVQKSADDLPTENDDIITEQATEDTSSLYTTPLYNSPAPSEETTTKEVKTEEATTEPTRERSLEYISNGNGTCTVSGIGDIIDTCIIIPEKSPLGEVVTSIGDRAFYANPVVNAIQIPSTVTHIGNMAFGGCTSLIYISVSAANNTFVDIGGILYTKDMEKLIHYPALKGNDTLTLPSTLSAISDMAFFDCTALKFINFDGTMSQWASVKIGEFNYGLFSVSVSCTDSKK